MDISDAAWKEMADRERQFALLFSGHGAEHVPSWYCAESRMDPEPLVVGDREAWLSAQIETVQANMACALETASLYRPIVSLFNLWGTHYMDRLFGAEVSWRYGQFWSEPVAHGVSAIEPPDLPSSPLVRESLDLARRIKERTKGRFLIAMPDVGCPLNIAVNLFGERFLLAVAEDPKAAGRALAVIAEATRRLHEAFVAEVDQEVLRCHNAFWVYVPSDIAGLSLCASQLLSPAQYASLVLKADEDAAPPCYRGMVQHICGHSAHQIANLARSARVKGVQLNDAGTDDLPRYFQGLREDQVIYAVPNATMGVGRILELTRGRRLVLLAKLDRRIPLPLA